MKHVLLRLAFAIGTLSLGLTDAMAEIVQPVPQPEMEPLAPVTLHTQFVPIPMYSTQPNEGSTFGFMPVFLRVRDKTKEVESIYAPSLSYNKTIRYTGSARWFYYPDEDRYLNVTASISTRTNWNGLILWQDLPKQSYRFTEELVFKVERNIFYRFFGFGPESASSDETSFTRRRQTASYRKGYNLDDRLNLGVTVTASNDDIEDIGVPDLPRAPQVFPDAPGMRGSAISSGSIDLRYDTRPTREYSEKGFFANLHAGFAQGLWNSPGFFVGQFDSRALVPETKWLQGGARLFLNYVSRDDVPFYHQSSLGGDSLMRGFTAGRFIDRGAWAFEVEQRVRVIRTNVFNVVADWRFDPFVTIGQVFSDTSNLFDHVKAAGGAGFRAWVHPNILGRVDIGYGGEGVKIYVDIGYPF